MCAVAERYRTAKAERQEGQEKEKKTRKVRISLWTLFRHTLNPCLYMLICGGDILPLPPSHLLSTYICP